MPDYWFLKTQSSPLTGSELREMMIFLRSYETINELYHKTDGIGWCKIN